MEQARHLSEVLADFALSAFVADLPPAPAAFVPKLLVDKIGLEIAGARFPWIEGVRKAVMTFPAQGKATTAYYGDLLSPQQAVFINASAGHAQDFDDTNLQARLHASGIMIPTALAMGEQLGSRPLDTAKAIAIGMEVMTRIGFAIPSSHMRGFHTPDVVGPFGAALTAGLLLGLDKAALVNALGVCGSFAGGVEEYTRTGGQVKRCLPGIAAVAGINAAYLAKEGLTGPPSVLEGDHGICRTFDDGTHVGRISDGLGKEWIMLQTAFKPYNCCYVIHAPLEAFLRLCGEHDIQLEDLVAVEVGHSKFGVDHVGAIRQPGNAVEAQFSCNFMLAIALVNGPPGEYDVTDSVVTDPRVRDLATKITMHVDPVAEEEQFEGFGSVVTVTLKSGQRYQERVRHSKGTPENPMTQEELETKFRNNLAPFSASARVEGLLAMLRGFLELDDLTALTQAMTRERLA
ncbi:MAG: MmgE/PrpD family protein [Planctomycetota bacterium]